MLLSEFAACPVQSTFAHKNPNLRGSSSTSETWCPRRSWRKIWRQSMYGPCPKKEKPELWSDQSLPKQNRRKFHMWGMASPLPNQDRIVHDGIGLFKPSCPSLAAGSSTFCSKTTSFPNGMANFVQHVAMVSWCLCSIDKIGINGCTVAQPKNAKQGFE